MVKSNSNAEIVKSNDKQNSYRKSQLHVAAVVHADPGHLIPMARMVSGIAAKGHKVTFYTFDYAKANTMRMIDQLIGSDHNVSFEGIPCYAEWMAEYNIDKIKNNDELHAVMKQRKRARSEFIAFEFERIMYPKLKEAFETNRPDVLLSDYLSMASLKLAEDMNIPQCVSAPISIRNAVSFSGLAGITHSPLFWAGCKVNFQHLGTFREVVKRSMERSLVFIHSFYGFEIGYEQVRLPPNFKVVGPVMPRKDDNTREEIPVKLNDVALDQWLYENIEENIPTILISTGSLMRLKRFQIKALYEGCVKAGVRVVWSLKQDIIDNDIPVVLKDLSIGEEEHEKNFRISSWIPQSDLLQHPAIHLAIIHSGWGGTLECVMAGKPTLMIPFFGDQMDNAYLVQSSGAGKTLCYPPLPTTIVENIYREGSLTSDKVCSSIKEVIGDERFAKNAMKLRKRANAIPGVSEAAKWLELTAWYGADHLTGVDTSTKYKESNDKLLKQLLVVVVSLVACTSMIYISRSRGIFLC